MTAEFAYPLSSYHEPLYQRVVLIQQQKGYPSPHAHGPRHIKGREHHLPQGDCLVSVKGSLTMNSAPFP
jgi:hypothetical protein